LNTLTKITIIYDNTLWDNRLASDWGFTCLVEAHGKTILFDTGAKGDILLSNMLKLGINPSTIDSVFISHDHWDHVDGLAAFLNKRNVTLFCPVSSVFDYIDTEIQKVDESCKLYDNIFSTGELGEAEKEHSLLIKQGEAITVIAGCSHPGVNVILEKAAEFGTVKNILGGFHDFSEIHSLAFLEKICPTHCSAAIDDIRRTYPEKFIEGGAGRVITF
jgi:7,8-dihydropterin-6-yl-methyl-4-(beta-D-ribofuranosyl)aminobenzene 5'-phosphate synthase